MTLQMIDLFAGTGAFTYAFEETNHVQCVFANDFVEPSQKIYNTNYQTRPATLSPTELVVKESGSPPCQHTLTLKDIHDINVHDIPAHDILTGGFSCQPFSIAGKREGFHDARSNVFWKIMEIVDHHQPKCIILENVKNLVTHDEGRTFETIQKNITDRGYYIKSKILDTAKITGVPQHRERIYLVCLKSKEMYDEFSLDFDEKPNPPISSILETRPIEDKYYYTERSSTWPLVKEAVVKKDTVYQYRRVYVRENMSNLCPTLTANMGTGGHNVPLILDDKGIRKLTPRECFRLQGFPDTYQFPEKMSDANLYKLAGNAVSVPVVRLIAQRLLPLLLE